jgi:hypothetical protein
MKSERRSIEAITKRLYAITQNNSSPATHDRAEVAEAGVEFFGRHRGVLGRQ